MGYRQITNSKRTLNRVEDIDGLKLRVIPNPTNVAWVKALGANPTPMPFAEVYGGLEQKAIDVQENLISVISVEQVLGNAKAHRPDQPSVQPAVGNFQQKSLRHTDASR